jgi:hypothetical protein
MLPAVVDAGHKVCRADVISLMTPIRIHERLWHGIPSAVRSTLAILLLAIGAGACASSPKPLIPVIWEGKWIRYASTVGRLPCGDSLKFMDQRIESLQTALDEPMSPGEKVTYYWLPGRMDLSPCPRGGDCAGHDPRAAPPSKERSVTGKHPR